MQLRWCWALGLLCTVSAAAFAAEPGTAVDRLLAQENAGKKVQVTSPVDDLGFLRRVYIDLVGRIPTQNEIDQFLALPKEERRAKIVDKLIASEQFADRWTVFFADMLRVRTGAEGGTAFLAFVHQALSSNMPYDTMCKQLLSATGKAGTIPEVGFVLGDSADAMALTGVSSQVFLGVRISCAQCHNHPFDEWTRKQFYDLAAFFGKTSRVESRLTKTIYVNENRQNTILWPPLEKAEGKTRTPVAPAFPFEMDSGDGPNKHLARLVALRTKQEAERAGKKKTGPTVDDLLDDAASKLAKANKKDDLGVTDEARTAAKNLNVQSDLYKASELRQELAKNITDPKNRYFSRNLVNRVWAELLGRGFVNPVDDQRKDNPPSHAKAFDYLADEFVANGYDFRTLVRMVVNTEAYQRSHLPQTTDPVLYRESVEAFVAAPVRRMLSEVMYDSIVQAGHLFSVKHKAGENLVTIKQTVQEVVVMKDDKGDKKDPKAVPELKKDDKKMEKPVVMTRTAPPGGYDLERSIELNFGDVLKKKDDISVEQMQRLSNEEIEAMEMMKKPENNKNVKVITKVVETTIDDNPRFTSSMRMASPAPVGHFLRVFGQSDRGSLDEKRDHSPSMRQALMMLNGKLSNEAARVGSLEPLYPLLVGKQADLTKAIQLAYREILTREANESEIAEAKKIIGTAGNTLDGMADLRWALFNCHEFRFIP